MDVPILKTKLYIPPARPELVPRPRLTERLNEGAGRRLTLVSAPAGFGKTTLLSAWVSGCGRPVAWVSLDKGDNDPARFWAYFVAALRTVGAEVGEVVLAAFQPPAAHGETGFETVLTALINEIAAIPQQFSLVLDDYHVIEEQPIHEAIAFLLDHLPPQMHMVIATRSDPPLPIARLRARGQLAEVRAADLRFTPEEAAEFLSRIVGPGLPGDSVSVLASRTEGWAAGLQMAAVSMRGREDVQDFIAGFTGSQHYVLDYLVEEVLQRQSEGVQSFLLQTSILDRLSGSLCDAVTLGLPPQAGDGQTMLEKLEHANLFIVPLDDRQCWYRYHLLFADFLRARLRRTNPDLEPELHRRASEWYEQNDLAEAAIDHTLSAGDFERAARLIEREAQGFLMRGEVNALLGWLEALPGDQLRSRPRLGIAKVWALGLSGQVEIAEAHLQDIERSAGLEDDLAGQAAVLRALLAVQQGDGIRALELVRRASGLLSGDSSFMRGFVTWILGFERYFDGDIAASDQLYTESIEDSQVVGNVFIAMLSIHSLGYQQMMRGRLRRASEIFQRGLQIAKAHGSPPSISMPYQGLGIISREWNDLEEAEEYLAKSIEFSERWVAEILADDYVEMARLRQAQGRGREALDYVQKAESLVHEKLVSDKTAADVKAHKVRLWVAQGNLEAASGWTPTGAPGSDQVALFTRQLEESTLARLLIARREFEKAGGVLEPLLRLAEETGWTGFVVENLALQALSLWGQSKTAPALAALRRAVSLAEPEGYTRIFADEGEPMAGLLLTLCRQEAPNSPLQRYLDRLLAAFEPGGRREEVPPATEQVKPFSERELEVLRLVAAGLSNREIADEMVVAVSTVKTHVNNIFRKLGVSSRTQAIARAREMGLI